MTKWMTIALAALALPACYSTTTIAEEPDSGPDAAFLEECFADPVRCLDMLADGGLPPLPDEDADFEFPDGDLPLPWDDAGSDAGRDGGHSTHHPDAGPPDAGRFDAGPADAGLPPADAGAPGGDAGVSSGDDAAAAADDAG